MKNSLGRVLLGVLVFLHVEFFASTYEWNASTNKTTAFVNEAIYLKYICEFSDTAGLYAIDFNPVTDNEDYALHMLSESERIVENKRVNSYEFVVFVKKAKEIDFQFNTTMKKTTKESIKNTVLGRDNKEYEDFTLEKIKQKSIKIDVKPSKKELVGDFLIEVKKDISHVKAYEPYHMQISIKGSGNFQEIKPIEFKIDGVKVFAGNVKENIELTKDGYSGIWSQKFAFVGSEDFKIPELKIEYFNIVTKDIDSLIVSPTEIKVEKSFVKEELLDEVKNDYKIDYDYIYYVLIFIAGLLLGKVKFKKTKKLKDEDELFHQKIDEVKSLKELMIILALKDSKKYEHIILDIETKKFTSLKDVKKLL